MNGFIPNRGGAAPVGCYPYAEPLATPLLEVVEEAIVAAFRQVVSSGTTDMQNEVMVTTALVEELNRLLANKSVSGFTYDQFETIDKGPELCNYSGRNIEKRPDIIVRRVGAPPPNVVKLYWGLFIECKVVDSKHPVSSYGSAGIMRFVAGDYAWAVGRGMMLGYASCTMTLPDKLKKHLRRQGSPTYEITTDPDKWISRTVAGTQVVETVHRRNWSHLNTDKPGNITLVHMWLT